MQEDFKKREVWVIHAALDIILDLQINLKLLMIRIELQIITIIIVL